MTINLSTPGVYVTEIPSGVHTITGVATSITAFIGRALRGPVDQAVTITSYGDFERIYGGLWTQSHLGYSVRDFFRLGGGTAVIVRVHNQSAATDTATLTVGTSTATLKLSAASPGTWGSKLKATESASVGAPDATYFDLTVTDTGTGVTEVFRQVSYSTTSVRRVDLVVAASSTLVTVDASALPTTAAAAYPVDSGAATAGGDGGALGSTQIRGDSALKTGMYALDTVDLFNLLVIPPYYPGTGDMSTWDIEPGSTVVADAQSYVLKRRAVLLLDAPTSWSSVAKAVAGAGTAPYNRGDHTAVYFPRIVEPDPLRNGQTMTFAPTGAIAGIIAATDANRGVWKSPAGVDAALGGVTALAIPLTNDDIGLLNPLGVNCLRLAPAAGHVVWGARTKDGDDRLASDWKYLAVRRTALFIEESLYRGLQWAVFEPNDEPLWASIRLNIGAFMNNLFRQGAFQGTSPKDAYFVKVDKDTTTQSDINLGVVNILVGFAPLKPAEFVVLRLQQIAGNITV
ncbi:MAG: phage tail sheath subtilisin-like domain-containing protein [Marmoricola sp.]